MRLLKGIGLLALLAFCLSSGVFGFFTSQATSQNNGMTAGTLYLGKDEKNRGMLEGSLKLSKMLPGDAPKEFKLTVKNVGDLKAYLNGLSASVKENDFKFMANAIKVTCTGPAGEKLYSGSLLSLDNNAAPTESEIALDPGEAKTLTFNFQLDQRAGNWYKGKNIEAAFTVFAGQNPGQKLETTVVIAGKNAQAAIDQAKPKSVILLPAGEYGRLQIRNTDITIKAKDVVYDTVVEGIFLDSQVQKVGIQGLTIDGKGLQDNLLTIPGSAQKVNITDNIFQNARKEGPDFSKDVKSGRSAGLTMQRNDFSALFENPDKLNALKPLPGQSAPVEQPRDGKPAPVPAEPQNGKTSQGNAEPANVQPQNTAPSGAQAQVQAASNSSQSIRYNLGLDLDPLNEAL
jgi:hypothetical protein